MSHAKREIRPASSAPIPSLNFAPAVNSMFGASIETMKKKAFTEGMIEGHRAGYDDGIQDGLRLAYAACAMALHEKYGFGVKRVRRAMKRLDEHVIMAVNPMELINQVEDLMDYRIYFQGDPDCPFDSRIVNKMGEQTDD